VFYLLLAILAEVTGTTCIKLSEGFTRLLPSGLIFVFYGLSLGFLGLALKKVDRGARLCHMVGAWDSVHSVGGRVVVQGTGDGYEGRLDGADRGGSSRLECS
jgi:hypothetical protein